MSNKRYGIFENVQFLDEGVGATIAVYGTIIGLALVNSIITNKKKKKELDELDKERAKQYESECKKRHEDNLKFSQDAKKYYSIYDIDEIDAGIFKDKDTLGASLLKDVKNWVKKIINSPAFKEWYNEFVEDEEWIKNIYDGSKPSLSYIKSLFKPEEGVNGLDETIRVISEDADQHECSDLCWVLEDLSRMIEVKYKNYIGNGVGTGDGDEGHLYYVLYV